VVAPVSSMKTSFFGSRIFCSFRNALRAAATSARSCSAETLVIDTVGIKTNAFTAADMYGTPQSAATHVIERYRLIDDALAKAAQDKYHKVQGVVVGGSRESVADSGLRLELTMDDPNVFAAPLSVLLTYRRLLTPWQEQVCAENPVEHYEGEWIGLPRADHPDF
jgi:hypothetical protein